MLIAVYACQVKFWEYSQNCEVRVCWHVTNCVFEFPAVIQANIALYPYITTPDEYESRFCSMMSTTLFLILGYISDLFIEKVNAVILMKLNMV